ncbi:beta-lactamase/transpeptidase-like protein [Trematosphaeria pertusa]|uniref:Beta-lactamase/transpeptidase-like protein n=1 Tax=Trematosphaeria pertusa TaxID=390896 RepID=A0A6A6IRS8_9PLEO|nr:beta-lactamase/transpeptidase-like protein [Trematosphaeria pertusa]KAF2252847.1 beta-lactamase/transpeptidase-like protein [Trematosphaeria pertusa]
MHPYRVLWYLLAFLPWTSAFCPLHGPVFPAPKDLASSSVFQAALRNLTIAYDTGLASTSGAIAVQIFASDSSVPLFEYYRDGTTLSNTTGVKKVDGDSIWRIASISKLVTVYLLLKEVGDAYWNVPVTDVIPELKGNVKWRENEVDFVKWDDVTLGALAGQISGVVNDLVALEGANPLMDPTIQEQLGLPPLPEEEKPPCMVSADPAIGFTCSREEFFAALDSRQPVFHANTKPIYSSTPFIILGYALESIAGKSFGDCLQVVIDALGLAGTSLEAPDPSRAVIPYDLASTGFLRKSGEAGPTGGLFSSINDLSKLGRSILNSTFLSPNTTRAWLKPVSFTSDMRSAVGRPWEVYRVDTTSSRGVIDIFGKGGDWGVYHTWLGLVPDYNIGFVSAVGGEGDKDWLSGQILDIVLPALEEAAREQADAAYAGTYRAPGGLNSTMTLSTKAGLPGLGVEQWISNGTNILPVISELTGESLTPETFRLLPTNLERKSRNGTMEIAWRTVASSSQPGEGLSALSACGSWFNVDGTSYGRYAFDEILFTLGPNGKAVKTSPRAFKVELRKGS